VVRVVLALVLLTSAGLKGHGLLSGASVEDSRLMSPHLQVAGIEMEILVGLWLLSGVAIRAAWVVAVGLFVTLAGMSLSLALDGQQSCGCFGQLRVSPWWSFALGVTAITALLIWRPRLVSKPQPAPATWYRSVATTALGAAAFLALIGGVFVVASEDPAQALAQWRGELIGVRPAVSQVGNGVAGEERSFTIQLTNNGNQKIQVIGGTTTCSCLTTKDLPITISPGESKSIDVNMTFRGTPGRFQHQFILYTDDNKQPIVAAQFVGRVTETPSP
jgi:hypothetical protein